MERTKVEIYLYDDRDEKAYISLTEDQLKLLKWLSYNGWIDEIGYEVYDKMPDFKII